MSSTSNVAQRRSRLAWMVPVIFAIVFFAGNAAVEILGDDLKEMFSPYQKWVWLAFGLSALAAIVEAIRQVISSKNAPTETADNSPSSKRSISAQDIRDSNVITGDKNIAVNRQQGDVFKGDKHEHHETHNYYGTQSPQGDTSGATSLHQLPPPPRDFTGRKDEIDELIKALDKGGINISGLHGQGGIGKTALALVLADMLKPRYPDAQFYLDLKGVSKQPLSAADAMSHIIRSYHPESKLPEAESQLSASYRSALHGKRALLVMDNAANREQVEPLLPPDGCVMLVTSRNRFTLPGVFAKNLDELSPEDARKLLMKIAPRIEGHAEEIARLCSHLPLALRVAASAIAERIDLKPADYVRRLTDVKQRLRMLEGVEASLQVSYELLSEEMQNRWRSLAVFPDTFNVGAVAAVWEMESDPAQDVISEMVKYSLADWNEKTDRYRLHDLARLFAGEKLNEEERYKVALLHSQHYAKVMKETNRLYDKGGESVKTGLELYDLELVNIEQGHSWAVSEAESNETAARLCIEYPDAGYLFLDLRQQPRELIKWLEVQLTAARRLKKRDSEGYALGNLGLAYADLGETRKAIEFFEQQLTIVREIGDRRGEGADLGNLGLAYAALGETRKAIEFYEQRLVIAREIGDRRGEGIVLWNKALALDKLRDREEAITCAEKSLKIKEEIEDPFAPKVRERLAKWKSGK